MLETGRGLILNSQCTQREMIAFAKTEGLAVPEHIVIPLGADNLPAPEDAAPLAEPYFVMLGTIDPRKNHLFLLHVWRRLAETMTNPPKIVIIGQRGWECEQVIDLLDRCVPLKGLVLEKPQCNDVELSRWLHHARALLFPSFTEGYGIPLVEALIRRVPVIASDLPVFREIAGDIPDYLDPLDGLGWQKGIQEYSQRDHFRRNNQLQRMANFQAPTWQAHFSELDRFLRHVFR